MLLQQLVAYADRLENTGPAQYDRAAVRYRIDLDAEGNRASIVTLTGDEGRRQDRGKEMFVPTLVRSSGINAKLLADNGEYALGWAREGQDAKKVADRHRAFLDRLRDCVAATGHPDVAAVLRLLEEHADTLARPDDFDPTAIVTFQVDGRLPIEDPEIQRWWAQVNAPEDTTGQGEMECLVCGTRTIPLEKIDFKIKGVPGGQTSGTALISANTDAFESYGLERSRIAPICPRCAEQFSKGLNALLGSERTRMRVEGLAYAFWTRDESFSVVDFLSRPAPEQVQALITSAWRGKDAALKIAADRFYAVALAGSGGRLAVRDWIDVTVEDARRNLAGWFIRQQIIRPDGTEPRPFSIGALVGATKREGARDPAPPGVPRSLLRSALTGSAVPPWLLGQVLRRTRVEQRVTAAQAALIKMALVDRGRPDTAGWEEALVELDTRNTEPAYLCGRLLAVLDAIQRAALGPRNATIIDRFYGTASTAPVAVFGRLIRGAQPHLAKLRRDRPGAYIALERRMQEILEEMPAFPRTLDVEDQALFALGYYHQRAADYKASREHQLHTEGAEATRGDDEQEGDAAVS